MTSVKNFGTGAALAVGLLAVSLACKQGDDGASGESAAPAVEPCPRSYSAATTKVGPVAELRCSCAPPQMNGSVWGSGVYTGDSSICNAAVHAGAVPAGGGEVTVMRTTPCAEYHGSMQYGVTSRDWGPWTKPSYYFKGYGDGKCVQPSQVCPRSFKSIAGANEQTKHTCWCLKRNLSGSVYGTDIYTTDSSICNAALHAGKVTDEGGEVTVTGAPGCKKYEGTSRNGVTSSKWGSYGSSFIFDGSDAQCVE